MMEKLFKQISKSARGFPYAVRTGLGLMVVLVFVLHAAGMVSLPLVGYSEGMLYDVRVRATMPDTISPQVVIIDIDEKSLKEEGRWPWSRERLGELVRKLDEQYKVAVVGMDVVFAEPENQPSLKKMQRLARSGSAQDREMKVLLGRLQPFLDGDRAFASALRGRNVVLGYYFKTGGNKEADNLFGKLPEPACDLGQAAAQGLKPQVAVGYGANLPLLQDAAAGGGISYQKWMPMALSAPFPC